MRFVLTMNPNVSAGGHHVFILKGNTHHGVWEYRVSVKRRTCRIFYVLDTSRHIVSVYYAGTKPNAIPPPPTIYSGETDVKTSSSHNNRRSVNRKSKT